LTLVLGGCRWNTGPDENYRQAAALYQQLYATELDDAYGDPKMEEVVALLHEVSARSATRSKHSCCGHHRARARRAGEAARRTGEDGCRAAQSASTAQVNIDPEKVLAAPPDAGPPQDRSGPALPWRSSICRAGAACRTTSRSLSRSRA